MNIDLKDATCRALVMYKTESRRTKQHNYKTRVFRTELQHLSVEKFEYQYGRKLKEQVKKPSKNIYITCTYYYSYYVWLVVYLK